MSDYTRVQEALKAGAEPEMLCATCPWDRYCITPPTMTADEVDAAMDKASAKDDAKGKADLPLNSLLTAMMLGGRDMQATVCPVFSVRLRSSAGREVVDLLKTSMQGWKSNV